jgi:tRNA-splicing ligase RtcB (3'-phosphate/5'-hydroxy nucleic acid ligase)
MPDTPDNITAIFGTHDEKTLAQLRDVASRAERAALMADGHLGYVMPIGGVAAYRNQASVVGVGFDIACGNAAIRTDLHASSFTPEDWTKLADEIHASISFGVGLNNKAGDAPRADDLFTDVAWDALRETAGRDAHHGLLAKARNQLGTVGSGNHYVDVFTDEAGTVWVGVHFGSRGFGHTVASGFLSLSQGEKWGKRVPEKETLLDLDTELGAAYWASMNLAGRYAYAGREWVARKVCSIMGAHELELIHNHHNFAWKETHGDENFIVVRKGATPAFPGQKGFVGGSMGDNSVILRGADLTRQPDSGLDVEAMRVQEMQRSALYSTVHGAGRVMSRTAAAGKVNRRSGKQISPGLVSKEMLDEWLGPMGVILRGGGLDEAPQAYRRLPDVIAAQGPTVEVLHTLTPVIVCMAGANEFDPYTD